MPRLLLGIPNMVGSEENIHVGPSDSVPWLTDRKWGHIHMEGRAFGDEPFNLELRLEFWDSPNSAGVIIDVVYCAKQSLDRKLKRSLLEPSSYFMKTPPDQYTDDEARRKVEAFIKIIILKIVV